MQEARSKFSVDVEPENAVIIDPLDGNLSPEGSAVLHFRRMSPSLSTGRIRCKVCLLFLFMIAKRKTIKSYQTKFVACYLFYGG